MRNVVVALAIVLIFAVAASAGEPEAGQFNFTVGGGVNMPTAEEANNGFVVGGGLGFHAAPRFVVGADLSYLGYTKQDGTMDILGTGVDYSMSEHSFLYMASAKYFLSTNRAAPYFKGFGGRFSYASDMVLGGESIDYTYSDFQFGGGVGLIVRGEKESNLYVEALFHSLQAEESSAEIFTVTMGMDVSFTP